MRHDQKTNLLTYRFAASVDDRQRSAEALAEISFHRYEVNSLNVRLDLLGDGRSRVEPYSRPNQLGKNHFWLFAHSPATKSVEVLGITGMSFEGHALLLLGGLKFLSGMG